MPASSKLCAQSNRAFTLIEIMVATAIMVVLIGLVIQITSSVLSVWNRSVDKLASNAQARIAMELITSDLETAVIRHNDLRWLESTQEAMLNPLDIPTLQTTRLALFAPAMDRLQITTDDDDKPIPIPGDVCAISYELVYQDPVDGEDDENDNIFSLHRRVIDAKTTFVELMGELVQEDFTEWHGKDVPSSVPLPTDKPDYQETADPYYFLASNIIDFRVDFFYVDEDGEAQNAGTEVLYGGTDPTIGPGSPLNFPVAYANITLRILKDEAMELLRRTEDGASTVFQTDLTKKEYIDANSEIYKRRVNFQSRPM